MISASLSLSLPRLGWKSTSMPRSLKICTAAGESASEMRTLGLDMVSILRNEKVWQSNPSPLVGEGQRLSEALLGGQSEACPPSFSAYTVVGTAQTRLCPPYGSRHCESEATKQSGLVSWRWIASLRSQ